MLEPCPVPLAGRSAALRAEAIERIIGEPLRVKGLVPHRIGDHYFKRADLAVRCLEFWVDHRVAALDLGIHVMDDGVHTSDGVAFSLQFLPVKFEWYPARGFDVRARQVVA